MDQQQQYCLKWSNYSSNLATAFSNLFNTETLTDVTLFCEGEFKMIMFKKGSIDTTVVITLETH
ncbi:CLUMA_CG013920, isoform A [Clunio marinus]|uniref:CLUMA_CG013920, isoform A n=1 Tax=Clunio marinus TaxID=568069 RepID=A0A1J1IM68_9DIPT|nr:CLUMA_CG013920, isoform A [Clunio marinus]